MYTAHSLTEVRSYFRSRRFIPVLSKLGSSARRRARNLAHRRSRAARALCRSKVEKYTTPADLVAAHATESSRASRCSRISGKRMGVSCEKVWTEYSSGGQKSASDCGSASRESFYASVTSVISMQARSGHASVFTLLMYSRARLLCVVISRKLRISA